MEVLARTSMVAYLMKPVKVMRKAMTMKGNRRRVKSDAKLRISSVIAPQMLGATVKRFVVTVE